jgi:hypothetical protein
MSLAVAVGQLAFLRREEPEEEVERFRKKLRAVNRVLADHGLPSHTEPESLPPFRDRAPVGGMPYDWLHCLRRAVAYAMRRHKSLPPLQDDEDPSEDRLYDQVLSYGDSHLICHSDCEGFYVPVDFPKPLYDKIRDDQPGVILGGILGSSQGGLRELVLAAPLLGIPLSGGKLSAAQARAIGKEHFGIHPHGAARKAWLTLFERLGQSVKHNTAVYFA